MSDKKNHETIRRFVNEGGLQRLYAQEGEEKAAEEFVNMLMDAGIRWIATDFDMTMTTVHSYGPVIEGSELHRNVVTSLSSAFNYFADFALKRGMKICVVTFNEVGVIELRRNAQTPHEGTSCHSDHEHYVAGEELIMETLQKSNAKFSLMKIYAYFPQLYTEKSSYEKLGLTAPMHFSKSFHLKSMCKDFNLTQSDIVFFDDDITNCLQGAKEGYLTINAAYDRGFHFDTLRVV